MDLFCQYACLGLCEETESNYETKSSVKTNPSTFVALFKS